MDFINILTMDLKELTPEHRTGVYKYVHTIHDRCVLQVHKGGADPGQRSGHCYFPPCTNTGSTLGHAKGTTTQLTGSSRRTSRRLEVQNFEAKFVGGRILSQYQLRPKTGFSPAQVLLGGQP